MEKTWEEFCMTGKVTDYLSYRSSYTAEERNESEGKRERISYGTVSCVDRDGTDRHAY